MDEPVESKRVGVHILVPVGNRVVHGRALVGDGELAGCALFVLEGADSAGDPVELARPDAGPKGGSRWERELFGFARASASGVSRNERSRFGMRFSRRSSIVSLTTGSTPSTSRERSWRVGDFNCWSRGA